MCDVILLEDVQEWNSLFGFTIAGIECHLKECKPEPKQIIDALIILQEQLNSILEEGEERYQKARAAK